MVVRETTTAEDVEKRGERVFVTHYQCDQIIARFSWRRNVSAYDEREHWVLQKRALANSFLSRVCLHLAAALIRFVGKRLPEGLTFPPRV
jgi:hypothetical protein